MRFIRKFRFAIAGAILLSLLAFVPIPRSAAAGSAVVSVEVTPGSPQTNQNVSLKFYVTPSSQKVNSVSVNVSLSKLKYVSYSGTGSAFNGIAQVVGGATDTNFTVIGGFQSFGGSSTKALILTVTAKTSSTAGTGQINLSGAEAYDTNEQAMSTTSQNKSIKITAPTTSGSSGSSSTSNQTQTNKMVGSSNAGSSNMATKPSSPTTSNNEVVVPGDETGPEAPGVVIPESQLVAAENTERSTYTPAIVVLKDLSTTGKIIAIAGSILGVIILIGFIRMLLVRRARAKELQRHVAGAVFTNPPDETNDDKKSKDDSKPSGPTIITPQR